MTSNGSSTPGPRELAIDSILAEGNIRHFWSGDERAKQMVASVRSVGVIEPVIVVPLGSRANGHRWRLICGFRRYSAACEAGLSRIPAVVKDGLTDTQILEVQLIENLQRLDMNPIEEARTVRDYIAKAGLDQEATGRRIGRSGAWVSLRLGLLTLPEEIQDAVAKGEISTAHATAIVPFAGRPLPQLLKALEAAKRTPHANWREKLGVLMGEIPRQRFVSRDVCTCDCSCCASHAVPGPHPGQAFA